MRLTAGVTAVLLGMAQLAGAGVWRTYDVHQPTVEQGYVYDGASGPFKYNHCATVAWHRDRWIALWNANTVPLEAKPHQPILMATSRDFRKWTEPVEPFNDPGRCTNPIDLGPGIQWQPTVVVHNDELWCIWNQHRGEGQGLYVSRLRDPSGKWTNEKIDLSRDFTIDGRRYRRFFPTQNGIRLRSGRVLLPGDVLGPRMKVAQDIDPWRKRWKRDSVMITDDGGRSWRLSPGATIPGKAWAAWEPTVWESPDGLVRMVARNNNWGPADKGGDPATRMLTRSVSRDGGKTWTVHEYLPIVTVASRMHVLPLAGDRFVMVHNDWPKGRFPRDRQNMALFFNRGGGFDFTAGVGVSGRDVRVAYPHMWVKDDAVHLVYSMQLSPSSIRWSRVSPLPRPDRHYLFPRSNTPRPARPAVVGKSLKFDFWQRLETRWVNQAGHGDLTIGMWVRPRNPGVLVDTRKGRNGFLFHTRLTEKGLVPTVFMATKEWNILSSLAIPLGRWCYLGVSVDNAAGRVHVFVNGRHETKPFTGPAQLTSASAYLGQRRFARSSVSGLVGEIRAARIFEGACLTAGQHASLLNAHASEFGMPVLGGAKPTPQPAVTLDPAVADWRREFVLPPDSQARVVTDTEAGRSLVRFHGAASAGVDLDCNRPAKGDVVELDFRFRIDSPPKASERIVLCTTGGGDAPLRLVVDGSAPGWVQAAGAGEMVRVGSTRAGAFTRVRLRIAAHTCQATVDDGRPVSVRHATGDTWLYLGDGYPDGRVPDSASFAVDLASVRSRVVRPE